YLRELSRGGVGVDLLTFEPGGNRGWDESEREEWRTRLESEGIRWQGLAYHKRPSLPTTVYDIASGAFKAIRIVRRERIDVMHARGYVPAAMGALAKWCAGGKLIFDIRGFMAEEYVDAGLWPESGLLYRLTKAAERKLFETADGFVVLSEKARNILFPATPIHRRGAGGFGLPVGAVPWWGEAERLRRFVVA